MRLPCWLIGHSWLLQFGGDINLPNYWVCRRCLKEDRS